MATVGQHTREMFDRFDTDKDGWWSELDFAAFIRVLFGFNLIGTRLKKCFQYLDTSRKGQIDVCMLAEGLYVLIESGFDLEASMNQGDVVDTPSKELIVVPEEGDPAQKYTFMDRVGSGSFGEIYKGVSKATGEFVALKIVDLERLVEDVSHLLEEVDFQAKCTSPHLVRYITSYIHNNKLTIVMEYLGGGTVEELTKNCPFNEEQCAYVIREILKGLDYMHNNGKIHRDIKAANVLVDSKGAIKLSDFGVSAQLTIKRPRRDSFVGTPLYMPPEIVMSQEYDHKVDIWSLGVLAIQIASGKAPYHDKPPMEILYAIASNPPPRLEGNWSSKFKDFVAKCLDKSPKNRLSARDLLEHPFTSTERDRRVIQSTLESLKKRRGAELSTDKASQATGKEDDWWQKYVNSVDKPKAPQRNVQRISREEMDNRIRMSRMKMYGLQPGQTFRKNSLAVSPGSNNQNSANSDTVLSMSDRTQIASRSMRKPSTTNDTVQMSPRSPSTDKTVASVSRMSMSSRGKGTIMNSNSSDRATTFDAIETMISKQMTVMSRFDGVKGKEHPGSPHIQPPGPIPNSMNSVRPGSIMGVEDTVKSSRSVDMSGHSRTPSPYSQQLDGNSSFSSSRSPFLDSRLSPRMSETYMRPKIDPSAYQNSLTTGSDQTVQLPKHHNITDPSRTATHLNQSLSSSSLPIHADQTVSMSRPTGSVTSQNAISSRTDPSQSPLMHQFPNKLGSVSELDADTSAGSRTINIPRSRMNSALAGVSPSSTVSSRNMTIRSGTGTIRLTSQDKHATDLLNQLEQTEREIVSATQNLSNTSLSKIESTGSNMQLSQTVSSPDSYTDLAASNLTNLRSTLEDRRISSATASVMSRSASIRRAQSPLLHAAKFPGDVGDTTNIPGRLSIQSPTHTISRAPSVYRKATAQSNSLTGNVENSPLLPKPIPAWEKGQQSPSTDSPNSGQDDQTMRPSIRESVTGPRGIPKSNTVLNMDSFRASQAIRESEPLDMRMSVVKDVRESVANIERPSQFTILIGGGNVKLNAVFKEILPQSMMDWLNEDHIPWLRVFDLLYSSETQYSEALQTILEEYVRPLMENALGPALRRFVREVNIKTIFSFVGILFQCSMEVQASIRDMFMSTGAEYFVEDSRATLVMVCELIGVAFRKAGEQFSGSMWELGNTLQENHLMRDFCARTKSNKRVRGRTLYELLSAFTIRAETYAALFMPAFGSLGPDAPGNLFGLAHEMKSLPLSAKDLVSMLMQVRGLPPSIMFKVQQRLVTVQAVERIELSIAGKISRRWPFMLFVLTDTIVAAKSDVDGPSAFSMEAAAKNEMAEFDWVKFLDVEGPALGSRRTKPWLHYKHLFLTKYAVIRPSKKFPSSLGSEINAFELLATPSAQDSDVHLFSVRSRSELEVWLARWRR